MTVTGLDSHTVQPPVDNLVFSLGSCRAPVSPALLSSVQLDHNVKMGDNREPTERLRHLALAASELKVDSRIPIRRYFRSGQEMLKMAVIYRTEGNDEAAYILYMKYMTLFVEKLKSHRDYNQIIPAEKKKVSKSVREAMTVTEELKKKLKTRYEVEYSEWLEEEMERKMLEERREEEERRTRAEVEASIERDRQVAEWHQAQLDQEERARRENKSSSGQPQPQSQPPPSYYDLHNYTDLPSAPPTAPPSYSPAPVPVVNRNSKPTSVPSSSSTSAPTFDRSAKPAESGGGLRSVVMPGDLTDKFLAIARSNSERGVETLGTLGGSLSNNRLIISHLLIPNQVGKSDSCTMEGLEDVWDVHDKENIVFLGWIHTHPAYSVFLSSVDMHNQYEWQHMLPEVSQLDLTSGRCETINVSGRGHSLQYQGQRGRPPQTLRHGDGRHRGVQPHQLPSSSSGTSALGDSSACQHGLQSEGHCQRSSIDHSHNIHIILYTQPPNISDCQNCDYIYL